jgi:hypothetical protein
MLIYIRGQIYNSSVEDVGILLDDSDKENIKNMDAKCSCYLAGPKLNEAKAEKMGVKLKQRHQAHLKRIIKE